MDQDALARQMLGGYKGATNGMSGRVENIRNQQESGHGVGFVTTLVFGFVRC